MKKNQCRLALMIMFLFANQLIFAQQNFVEGFVVLTRGDTLRGKIDYRNWEVNPLNIQFQDNSGIKKFSPDDLVGFTIPGWDTYISRTVTKDMRLVNITDVLTKYISDTTITERVFLRELLRGKHISLYELQDFKIRFYTVRADSTNAEELLYKVYPNASNTGIEERNIFRDQLTGIAFSLNAAENVIKKISRVSYEKNALLQITAVLNGEKGSSEREINKPKKRQFNNQLLIGGGVQLASFSFTGSNYAYNGLQFDNTISPIIGLAYDAFSPRGQQRFGMRFALSYSSLHLKGESTGTTIAHTFQRSYELSQNNITPEVGGYYHFINGSKVRVYVGLSLATSFSSYGDIKMEEKYDDGRVVKYDEIAPAQVWFAPKLLLGARILNTVDIGVSTKILGSFYSGSDFSSKYPYLNFTVAYILNTGKK